MQPGALGIRRPVAQGASAVLDTGSTSITSAAFVQLLTAAQMLKAASGIIVTNGGSQPLMFATGGAGSEVNSGVIIPPGGGQVIIPVELKAAVRLSLKSLGATQSAGVVTVSFFQ